MQQSIDNRLLFSYSHWGMFEAPDTELRRLRNALKRINEIALANSTDD